MFYQAFIILKGGSDIYNLFETDFDLSGLWLSEFQPPLYHIVDFAGDLNTSNLNDVELRL